MRTLIFIDVNFILFSELGIGAGLESMTVNNMAWDASVNPRVCFLLS